MITLNTSPLIEDGALSLNSNGDLVFAPDLQTQMPVTLTAYDCIWNPSINSQLIAYLNTIPVGGYNSNTIQNIIVTAYQLLISNNIITDLKISIQFITISVINIKITAIDTNGQPINLNWNNLQTNLYLNS